MTKEELKQQFYKYIKDHEDYFDPREPWTERIILQIWLDCAEPREKQIAELEQKLEQTEKDLADYQFNYPTIKELQKENADLKEEINKIAFARGNLEEENAELKEENQKWKDEWQEQVQKATDEGYTRTLQTMQLTKAKEIIKELMSFSVQLCDCRHTVDFEKTREEAKQFLSEVNK